MASAVHPGSTRQTALRVAGSRHMMEPPEPFDITKQKLDAKKKQLSQSSVILGDAIPEYHTTNSSLRMSLQESEHVRSVNQEQRALADKLRLGARETTHDFGDGLSSLPLEHHRNMMLQPQSGIAYRSEPTINAWQSQLKLGDDSLKMAGKSILHESQQQNATPDPESFHLLRQDFVHNKQRNGQSKVWMGPKTAIGEAGSVPNLSAAERQIHHQRQTLVTPLAGAGSHVLAQERLSLLRDSSLKLGDSRFDSIPQEKRHRNLPAIGPMDMSAQKQYHATKKALRGSQIVFGQEKAEYSQSNHMPNWHDPNLYEMKGPEKPKNPKDFFAYSMDFHHS